MRVVKHTSQHCCDKRQYGRISRKDNKMAVYREYCFPIVQKHGE